MVFQIYFLYKTTSFQFLSVSVGEGKVLKDSWEDRCKETWIPPSTIVNTTERVGKLRMLMQENNYSALIVPSNDAHNVSEVIFRVNVHLFRYIALL